MPSLKGLQRESGISLLELLASVAILTVVAITFTAFMGKEMRVKMEAKHRDAATILAQDKIHQITKSPYELVHLTPYQDFGYWNCSCSTTLQNYDKTWYPPESKIVDGAAFRIQTCVGMVTPDKATTFLANECPDHLPDSGLRRVHVAAQWTETSGPKMVEMDQLLSRDVPFSQATALAGFLAVTVCKADAVNPNICDPSDPGFNSILGAEVAIFKTYFGQNNNYLAKISGSSPIVPGKGREVTITVPQDDQNAVVVDKPGFFPQSEHEITVLAGETQHVSIMMKSVPDYDSRAAAEIFVADHVVISKVIPSCGAGTAEAVELYNPTAVSKTISTAQIKFGGNPIPGAPPSITIPSRAYFLILGTPSSNPKHDLTYPSGLLPAAGGTVAIGSDLVGWGTKLGEGTTALAAPGCSSTPPNGFVRKVRRGEGSNTALWPAGGPAYDTDQNNFDFVITNGVTLHDKTQKDLPVSGTPASLLGGTTVQVGEPTSPLVFVKNSWSANSHLTTLASIPNVQGTSARAWVNWADYKPVTMTVVSGKFAKNFNVQLKTRDEWSLLPSPSTVAPLDPAWCLTGPCDADGATVPHPPALPANPDYGSHPDVNTPYVVLDGDQNYAYITGTVTDTSGVPLPEIGVSLMTGADATYPWIEKLTDSNGKFTVLVATSVPVQVYFNAFHTIYGRRWYRESPVWNFKVKNTDYGNIYTVPKQKIKLNSAAPAPTQQGAGCIQGRVTAQENGVPISSVTIQLTNTTGSELNSTLTDANGRYQFIGLTGNQGVTVLPILDRGQGVQGPPSYDVTTDESSPCPQLPDNNFMVKGVLARIHVAAPQGSLIVASTFTYSGSCSLPPTIEQHEVVPSIFSSFADAGSAEIPVPMISAASTYYLCCWVPNAAGGGMTHGQLNGSFTPYSVAGLNLSLQGTQTGSAIQCGP